MDDDQHQTPPAPQDMPPPPPAQPVQPRGMSAQPGGPVRAAARPATGRIRTGAYLTLIGGAIVLLRTFLPRFTITTAAGTPSLGGLQATGLGPLIPAGFAIAKGLE